MVAATVKKQFFAWRYLCGAPVGVPRVKLRSKDGTRPCLESASAEERVGVCCVLGARRSWTYASGTYRSDRVTRPEWTKDNA